MWEAVESAAGSGTWDEPTALSGEAPSKGDPIATVDPNNTVVVFALAEDGSVHERFIGPRKKRWTGWRPLNGEIERLVTAVQDGGGTLVVLGIGKNGSMEQTCVAPARGSPRNGAALVGTARHSRATVARRRVLRRIPWAPPARYGRWR